MNISAQEILPMVIALGGFIGTIALLVLNLRVQAAMGEMRSAVTVELTRVELQMERARTEAAQDRANLYERIMETMARTFVNRDASDAMHRENSRRLDDLKLDVANLNQRVSDIG